MFDFVAPATGASTLTMAELIDVIRADQTLSDARHRNVACSIRRFCTLLDGELEQTEASFEVFRDKLKGFHPLSAGVTKRRWQTIKSDVSFALKRAGVQRHRSDRRIPYSPVWQALKVRADLAQLSWRLSRLAHFADARGQLPTDIDDEVMADYYTLVRTQTFKTTPERHHRAVCLAWNKLAAKCPDLGLRRVFLPNNRETYTLPWAAHPPTLCEEADRWLEGLSKEADLLSEEGPIRPLSDTTIDCYRYAIRQLVGALIAQGIALEELDSLCRLVEPSMAKKALQFFLDRNGGKTSTMIYNLAHVLVLVAETQVKAPTATVDLLKRYRKQLVVRARGMRPKPREALRPFADPGNIEKILILPIRIYRRLRRKPSWTLQDARLMQVAVALELLLMRPIRRRNLVQLRLGKHVVRTGNRTFIVIEADDVKNGYELDYPIPGESVKLLEFYTKKLLPLFGPNPDRFLFPGKKPGCSKSPEQFGRFFTKVILEETGLRIYLHLMRHFGAKLYLGENPGAFETVRRVLGHKSLSTTTRSYASLDDEVAVRMFDEVILGIRGEIRRELLDG